MIRATKRYQIFKLFFLNEKMKLVQLLWDMNPGLQKMSTSALPLKPPALPPEEFLECSILFCGLEKQIVEKRQKVSHRSGS